MVEKKIKESEKNIKKPTKLEDGKKQTTKGRKQKISSKGKTEVTSKKIHQSQLKDNKETSGFISRTISSKNNTEDKTLPTRLILLFIFSLVFFLFSLYKVFIYGKGYNLTPSNFIEPNEDYHLSLDKPDIEIINPDPELARDSQILEEFGPESSQKDTPSNDIAFIESFYSHLSNNEIDEMNALVDRPLKNTETWGTHRSKKNIGIFTKHLDDTVMLSDIYLIPNTIDEMKNSRKYSYNLQYSIDQNMNFSEEREITLLTREGKTYISEIACKTQGCSHSPFFRPQNYHLK